MPTTKAQSKKAKYLTQTIQDQFRFSPQLVRKQSRDKFNTTVEMMSFRGDPGNYEKVMKTFNDTQDFLKNQNNQVLMATKKLSKSSLQK